MRQVQRDKLKTFRCYSHHSRNKPKPVPPGCDSGEKSIIYVLSGNHGRNPGDGDENSDHGGSSTRRCLDGTWSDRARQSRTHLRTLGVKRCVSPRPSREKTPTWSSCWSRVGCFHLRPCHRLQLRRGSWLLAPGSCFACSRQLANTVGRKAPGEADTYLLCARAPRHSPAFPDKAQIPQSKSQTQPVVCR